jgi:O-antigen ligase
MIDKPAVKSTNRLIEYMGWICLFILAMLPFHAFVTTWAGSVFGHIDVFRIWKELLIFVLVIKVIYIVILDKKLQKQLFNSVIFRLSLIYVIITILRTFAGYNTHSVNFEAAIYGLLANLRYLVFFFVVMIVASKTNILKKYWAYALLGPAMIVTIFGLAQKTILPKDFLTNFGYSKDTIPAIHTVDNKSAYIRLQSTLRGPNPLGAYLTVILTAITTILITMKDRQKKIILWSFLGLGIVVLFFSFSRSAWLGTAVSLGVLGYLLLSNKRAKTMLLYVVMGLMLLFLGLVYVGQNNDFVQNTIFHSDEKSRSATSSNENRQSGIVLGLKDVYRHPLGQGAGSAGPASARNNRPAKIAENYYIQISQEVGIFGLITLVAINVFVATELYKRRNDNLALILFASFCGITVINMVSHAWMDDTLALLWWGLAGIALSEHIQHKPRIINPK